MPQYKDSTGMYHNDGGEAFGFLVITALAILVFVALIGATNGGPSVERLEEREARLVEQIERYQVVEVNGGLNRGQRYKYRELVGELQEVRLDLVEARREEATENNMASNPQGDQRLRDEIELQTRVALAEVQAERMRLEAAQIAEAQAAYDAVMAQRFSHTIDQELVDNYDEALENFLAQREALREAADQAMEAYNTYNERLEADIYDDTGNP